MKCVLLSVPIIMLALTIMTGACPHAPSNVANAKCTPAHLDQPNIPAGQLCHYDIRYEECEEVNCVGTFTQIAVSGYCGGLSPASGMIGCRENHGSVDLWKKVYSAFCPWDSANRVCDCRLKQQTDPVTGQPVSSITRDVCECTNI